MNLRFSATFIFILLIFFSCAEKKISIKNIDGQLLKNLTTEENTQYHIRKSLTIEKNITLTISQGVKLTFCDTCKIICYGKIKAFGNKKNPITVGNSFQKNTIIFKNSKSRSSFNNVSFINISLENNKTDIYIDSCSFKIEADTKNKVKTNAIILSNKSFISLKNSHFKGNNIIEGVGVNHGRCIIENNTFDLIPDAIELSNINDGTITKNIISHSQDDGIDLNNCTGINISYNTVQFSKDKGLSIGNVKPQSLNSKTIHIFNNLLINNKIGVSIKGVSTVKIKNCILENNKIGVHYESKKTPSLSTLKNTYFINNNTDYKGSFHIETKDCYSDKDDKKTKKFSPINQDSLTVFRKSFLDID